MLDAGQYSWGGGPRLKAHVQPQQRLQPHVQMSDRSTVIQYPNRKLQTQPQQANSKTSFLPDYPLGPGGTPTSGGGSGGPEGGFVDRWRSCGATGGQDALHTLPQERGMLTMVGLTNAMKYDAYQQEHLVARLGNILDRSVPFRHIRLPRELWKFEGLQPKPCSMCPSQYLRRMLQYGQASPCCVVVAMVFLERLNERLPWACLTALNVQRLLLTLVMLSSKTLDDYFCSNKQWALIGDIETRELNTLELEVLLLLDFKVNITREEYDQANTRLEHLDFKTARLHSHGARAPTTATFARYSPAQETAAKLKAVVEAAAAQARDSAQANSDTSDRPSSIPKGPSPRDNTQCDFHSDHVHSGYSQAHLQQIQRTTPLTMELNSNIERLRADIAACLNTGNARNVEQSVIALNSTFELYHAQEIAQEIAPAGRVESNNRLLDKNDNAPSKLHNPQNLDQSIIISFGTDLKITPTKPLPIEVPNSSSTPTHRRCSTKQLLGCDISNVYNKVAGLQVEDELEQKASVSCRESISTSMVAGKPHTPSAFFSAHACSPRVQSLTPRVQYLSSPTSSFVEKEANGVQCSKSTIDARQMQANIITPRNEYGTPRKELMVVQSGSGALLRDRPSHFSSGTAIHSQLSTPVLSSSTPTGYTGSRSSPTCRAPSVAPSLPLFLPPSSPGVSRTSSQPTQSTINQLQMPAESFRAMRITSGSRPPLQSPSVKVAHATFQHPTSSREHTFCNARRSLTPSYVQTPYYC